MQKIVWFLSVFFCFSTFLAHAIVTGSFVYPPTPIASFSSNSNVYSCYNSKALDRCRKST